MSAANQITAQAAGLMQCSSCHKLLEHCVGLKDQKLCCPRCGASVSLRTPDSFVRTWALLLTALMCLIPANIYPIMTVIYQGQGSPATIFGGVIELIQMNMIPIALVVFFASIAVPFLKIGSLVLLLASVQLKWKTSRRQRTTLYALVEGIGRWSMLDVFTISILVALVKLGAIAEIQAGLAATFFVATVVFTMLAARSFDSRLIWDV